MTISTSILNEIWKTRNLFKHEQKKISTDNIIQNIKINLKEIIIIHLNKHDRNKNNKILSFQEKFSIDNALCAIRSSSLTFHFKKNKTKDLSHTPVIRTHTRTHTHTHTHSHNLMNWRQLSTECKQL